MRLGEVSHLAVDQLEMDVQGIERIADLVGHAEHVLEIRRAVLALRRAARSGSGSILVVLLATTVLATFGSAVLLALDSAAQEIAHALVGTFLGILLSYGFVAPLVGVLEKKGHEASKALERLEGQGYVLSTTGKVAARRGW